MNMGVCSQCGKSSASAKRFRECNLQPVLGSCVSCARVGVKNPVKSPRRVQKQAGQTVKSTVKSPAKKHARQSGGGMEQYERSPQASLGASTAVNAEYEG